MAYATFGPFDREDVKALAKVVKLGDPVSHEDWPAVIMENAPLYVLSPGTRTYSIHAGGKLVTVFYLGKPFVLCETLNPFAAHYIGTNEEISNLNEGFGELYEKVDPKKNLYEMLHTVEDAGALRKFVEHFYSKAPVRHSTFHSQVALRELDIDYNKYDENFLEEEKRQIEEAIKRLKTSGKLSGIIEAAKRGKLKSQAVEPDKSF